MNRWALGRRSVPELEREAARIADEIARHPLASDAFTRAQSIIDQARASGARLSSGSSAAADVEARLAADGLPSLSEIGRLQVSGLRGWARLHRDQRRVREELRRRGSGDRAPG